MGDEDLTSADEGLGLSNTDDAFTSSLRCPAAQNPMMASPEYQGYIQLKDTYAAYDIATSPANLYDLIMYRLESPNISQETKEIRESVFSKYVSDIEGGATRRYREKLNEVIESARVPR